jgi:uncharacterized protein (DUF1330 family)
MSGYIVVQITVHDAARYERYKQLSAQAVEAFGGRFIVRGGATEALEGSWTPSRLVIIEFPSTEVARRWWDSQEYAEGRSLRHEVATSQMLLVQGVEPAG